MNDTIYSAEFAKQLCNEYHTVEHQINREIKEAVSNGNYRCGIFMTGHDKDDEDIVNAVNKFRMLGYRVQIFNYDFCAKHSVKLEIHWD